MPIKMLKVSFDLPIEVLLKAVSEHNVGLNIQAYQQAAEPYEPPTDAIEDQSKASLRSLVLRHFKHTGQTVAVAELREIAEQNGYSAKALYNLLWTLCHNKLISKLPNKRYRITRRGSEY